MTDTVADAVARSLRRAGIEYVFGLPGGENAAVLDAVRRAGLRFVLARSEASAVYMADAAARLTGLPGVCLATLGPGAANAVAGAAHAYLDRSPVIIITAQVPEADLPGRSHQHLDLGALFAPVTKASMRLRSTGAYETLRSALELSQAGRPGPVHLELDSRTAAMTAAEGGEASDRQRPTAAPLSEASIGRAAELLAAAARPVLLVGLGLEPERPYAELRQLAEAAGAPVIATPKAKGCLPDDHPLFVGAIGLTHTDPSYEILDEADCIAAVGFDVVELVRLWDQTQSLIWIAPWANEDPRLPAEVEFAGAVKPVLQRLAEQAYHPSAGWGAERVARHRREQDAQPHPRPKPGRILPQTLLHVLRRLLPRDVIVASDVGSHKILASLTWPTYTPNSYLVANGLSPMGYGLPAAIAAGILHPGRCVVCLTGDGGLAMVEGELGLLAQLDGPVIIVVFRDDALDLIRSHQVRAGFPVYGTEFTGPDWSAVARAHGIEARSCSTKEECEEAVRATLEAGGAWLIEARIDPVSYPTTPPALQGPAGE